MRSGDLVQHLLQHPSAPGQDIELGPVKIAGVPWIADLTLRLARILHQHVEFPIKVPAADAAHVSQVGLVHPDQQIIPVVVFVLKLPGRLPIAPDPMLRQLLAGRPLRCNYGEILEQWRLITKEKGIDIVVLGVP